MKKIVAGLFFLGTLFFMLPLNAGEFGYWYSCRVQVTKKRVKTLKCCARSRESAYFTALGSAVRRGLPPDGVKECLVTNDICEPEGSGACM